MSSSICWPHLSPAQLVQAVSTEMHEAMYEFLLNDENWVAAVRARPRVAVALSSRGTDIGVSQALTYKGTCHVRDDAETKSWFYPALAARVRPDSPRQQQAFVDHLDSPRRVIFEIVPDTRIGFDAEADAARFTVTAEGVVVIPSDFTFR